MPEEVPAVCPVCPETGASKEQCIAEKGAENCVELIEAHRQCMEKFMAANEAGA